MTPKVIRQVIEPKKEFFRDQSGGCDWCVTRYRSRTSKKADRKRISRGCKLSQHRVCDDPAEHDRFETGRWRYCSSGDREASSRHHGPEFWENRSVSEQCGR